MKSKEKFINFPLMALAYGSNELERLEVILMWAVITVGRRALDAWLEKEGSNEDHVLCARMDKLQATHDLGTLDDDEDGHSWALGMETLGLNSKWRDAEACLKAHERLEAFCERMQSQTGRADKLLCHTHGLKLDWLLAARRWHTKEKGKTLRYSHFAVLAAVLSKIGHNKPPCKTATWEEIQRRALGYVDAGEMANAMPFRQDNAKPLSRDMIDRRTKQLALWGLFLRYVPKIGKKSQAAWYGSGMDLAALMQHAEQSKAKRRGGWEARWRKQQAEQAALAGKLIDSDPARNSPPSNAAMMPAFRNRLG